jgi:hypothetical protein
VFNQPDVCYVRLRPGRYWVALKSITATTTFRGLGAGVPSLFISALGAGGLPGNSGYIETFATAGLPSTATPAENAAVTAQAVLQLRAVELA